MAIDILFGRDNPGQIGNLVLDATISENQNYSNRITEFPIEDGSTITDHIMQEPEELTIEGFVTDTPTKILGGISSAGSLENSSDRSYEAFVKLLEIAGYKYPGSLDGLLWNKSDAAKLDLETTSPMIVEVVAGFRVFKNMAISKLSIPRKPDTGDALYFTATFKKVKIIDSFNSPRNKAVDTNPNAKRVKSQAAKPADVGAQNTSGFEERESILFKGLLK